MPATRGLDRPEPRMSTLVPLRRPAPSPDSPEAWRERSGRLYADLRRPARAMVRRAFRNAFDDDEIDDVYSNAWLGTLRALERRHHELSDEEIRKYVFTAVANHASKELRRRKRRPTAPLEAVHAVVDHGVPPDERASKLEDSQITRDLLASLPPRRRAVMLLRYGWGLEPRQVCGLIKGLSLRAYRKEITRGVDELAAKLRLLEQGDWCADREPILKAYAAGLADREQERQAQQHLSHCRHCGEFVGRLTGHLHDVGASLAVPGAIDAIGDRHLSAAECLGDLIHRVRDSAANLAGGRAPEGSSDGAAQTVTASGGARGAGAAGTGAIAKLAGLGGAGKLAALCLGGGAAATICVASGVVPVPLAGVDRDHGSSSPKPPAVERPRDLAPAAELVRVPPRVEVDDASGGADSSSEDVPPLPAEPPPAPAAPPAEPAPAPAPAPATSPIAPSTPPQQQEFGVASAAPTAGDADTTSSTSNGGGGGSAAQREFGGP
jgi:RNA polymerase sigma factor (sigma-70 family)